MRAEIRKLQKDLGITTIYVTHDQEEALTLSDRIAVIDHGKLQQLGSPRDLYEKPETPFVADFIGINNLIPGTVQEVNSMDHWIKVETKVGPMVCLGDSRFKPGTDAWSVSAPKPPRSVPPKVQKRASTVSVEP